MKRINRILIKNLNHREYRGHKEERHRVLKVRMIIR
jgi:hypothetical protein